MKMFQELQIWMIESQMFFHWWTNESLPGMYWINSFTLLYDWNSSVVNYLFRLVFTCIFRLSKWINNTLRRCVNLVGGTNQWQLSIQWIVHSVVICYCWILFVIEMNLHAWTYICISLSVYVAISAWPDFNSRSQWKPCWAGRNAIMSKKSFSVIYFVNNINLRIKVF